MIKLLKDKEKLLKAALTLLAAFLMLIGPTYLLLILQNLGVPHIFLVLSALASFAAGIILILYLTRVQQT